MKRRVSAKMEQYFILCRRVLMWYDELCSVYIYKSANSIDRCFIKQTTNILKVKGTQICQHKANSTLVFSKSNKQPIHIDQMWLRQIKLN